MALSGLLMNGIIAFFYSTDEVGIFNETYAWYIVLSQLSVCGIHMAVVKYIPEEEGKEMRGSYLKSALIVTLISSLLVTAVSEIVLFFLRELPWRRSMIYACFGLMFFSINKVLINYLNAVGRMIAFAVFTSLRYGSIAVIVLVISVLHMSPDYLALTFPLTETGLFLVLQAFIFVTDRISGHIDRSLERRILAFGVRILPSYMVLEMNTKADVICLGFLIRDPGQIGVYSFAVLFAEGFYQLFVTVRRFINPRISENNAKGSLEEYLEGLRKKMNKYLVPASIGGYGALLAGYAIICLILSKNDYMFGLVYIAIICLAIVINGKYIIFGDFLAQTGFPFDESVLNIITVSCNLIFNVLLILAFGTTGASVATAISYFAFSLFMRYRIKNRTGYII